MLGEGISCQIATKQLECDKPLDRGIMVVWYTFVQMGVPIREDTYPQPSACEVGLTVLFLAAFISPALTLGTYLFCARWTVRKHSVRATSRTRTEDLRIGGMSVDGGSIWQSFPKCTFWMIQWDNQWDGNSPARWPTLLQFRTCLGLHSS